MRATRNRTRRLAGAGRVPRSPARAGSIETGVMRRLMAGVGAGAALGLVWAGSAFAASTQTLCSTGAGKPVLAPSSAGNCASGQSAIVLASGAALRSLQSEVSSLQSQVGALKGTLAGVTRSGKTLKLTGLNLQILSGTGSTSGPVNGLGNVIIGYNEMPGTQTGSHNLILGDDHTFTSYAGIIDGQNNKLNGAYAAVFGFNNTASGNYSSVTGGNSNAASGNFSSVTGGQSNTASGTYSSVNGGQVGTARGDNSSVSGGGGNIAQGNLSSITGGQYNLTLDPFASITGGCNNSPAQEPPAALSAGATGWNQSAAGDQAPPAATTPRSAAAG